MGVGVGGRRGQAGVGGRDGGGGGLTTAHTIESLHALAIYAHTSLAFDRVTCSDLAH